MSNSDKWETPPDIFNLLHNSFNFDLDVCASDENHLLPEYHTKQFSCLVYDNWFAQKNMKWGFMNPPYGRECPIFITKAHIQSIQHNNNTLCLIASRTGTKIWQEVIYPFARSVTSVSGRIRFQIDGKPYMVPDKKTGKMKLGSPDFDSAIVTFSNEKLTTSQQDTLIHFGYTEFR